MHERPRLAGFLVRVDGFLITYSAKKERRYMDRDTYNLKKTYFHAERTFRVNDVWYYMTRGGGNVGPFATKELAIEDSARYIAQIELACDSMSSSV